MNHAYRFIHQADGAVPVAVAVQDGNYDHINPKTKREVTVREISAFAGDYLKADFVFWCTQEPYFSRDVVPYFKR
jgi:hypothetical protein